MCVHTQTDRYTERQTYIRDNIGNLLTPALPRFTFVQSKFKVVQNFVMSPDSRLLGLNNIRLLPTFCVDSNNNLPREIMWLRIFFPSPKREEMKSIISLIFGGIIFYPHSLKTGEIKCIISLLFRDIMQN